jgi:hypothetical protein
MHLLDASVMSVWDGARCTKCGHFYAVHTTDGMYYGVSKPCLYCDNPHLGYKVRSQGCLGLILVFLIITIVFV